MISASITNIIYIIITYYLWRAIYAGTETLNGLSFEQSFLYLSLASTFFSVFKTFVDQGMSRTIVTGEIANYLLKPIEHQAFMMADNLGRIATNILFIVIPAFALVNGVIGIPIHLNMGILVFIPSVILAYKISFLIDYLVGCIAFYTESIWGIFTVKDSLIMVLSGVAIPFAFFPEELQEMLTWSPFVAIYHTPVSLLLGNLDTQAVWQGLANQAIWLVIIFVLSRTFFHHSIKQLTINGG